MGISDHANAEDRDNGPTEPVPQFVPTSGRARLSAPPPKVFATRNLANRSLTGTVKQPTLLERLHGPVVKWPRKGPSKSPALHAPMIHDVAARPPAAAPSENKGENMSERFISERLLSDRGTSFNPQIPRRVPDIPSPASVKAAESDTEGKRLVVGKLVSLSGEIGGCERLVVEGKVDATLHDVKVLEVGAQGAFKGTATVESATIAGSFEGTLKVSGALDIGPGAVVKGTVSYGTIAIATGGKLLGTVESA